MTEEITNKLAYRVAGLVCLRLFDLFVYYLLVEMGVDYPGRQLGSLAVVWL